MTVCVTTGISLPSSLQCGLRPQGRHCSCPRCPFLSFKVLIRNPETSQGVKTRPPSHLFSRWNLEFSSCPMKQPGLNLHYSKHPIEREISVREAGPAWLP